MAARHTLLLSMSDRLCKLCIALGREDRSFYRTADQIVADARTILVAGDDARAALVAGKCPQAAFAKAVRTAQPYGARVVERRDVHGVVLGLRFSSGHFVSGADNLYKIS